MWQEIKRIIKEHQHFVLTTHVNPDGDGIGSSIALAELLIAMGKEARIVCDSPLPDRFCFLDVRHLYSEFGPVEAEVALVLDTHKRDRLGRMVEVLDPLIVACIDHHPQVEDSFDVVVCDEEASSVGAMVYTLFKESGYPLNLNAANGIYTSIVCDTGRFSYSSTSRKAHKLADECIKIGVDPDQIHTSVFQQLPYPYLQVLARAMQRMELCCEERVLVQTVLKEDYEDLGVDPNDLDYIHEINKSVKGVECAILLRELPGGNVRVSWRAGKDLDIDRIARELGGGGHARAAGAIIEGPINDAKSRVLSLSFKDA